MHERKDRPSQVKNRLIWRLVHLYPVLSDSLLAVAGGAIAITTTTFAGNTATGGGGGLAAAFAPDRFRGGNGGDSAGGAFAASAGRVTLSMSTLSGNTAAGGPGGVGSAAYGGCYDESGCWFFRGARGGIGGLAAGGAISNTGATLSLVNATLAANTASGGGGGTGGPGYPPCDADGGVCPPGDGGNGGNATGGAVAGQAGTLVIAHSTVAGNTVTPGAGGAPGANGTAQPGSPGRATAMSLVGGLGLKHSIVVGGGTVANCAGTIVDTGGNLQWGDTSCGGFPSADPRLGPLGYYGGATQTFALLPGSPAIDAVPVAACTDYTGRPVTTDQRGVPRPQGPACDSGALEVRRP